MKKIATTFFRWWYNQKGTNTDQGYDAWAQTEEGKKVIGEYAKQLDDFVNKAIRNRSSEKLRGLLYLIIGIVIGILLHFAYDVYFVQYYKF